MKYSLLLVTSILFLSSCINVFKLSNLQPDNTTENHRSEYAEQLKKQMGKAHGIENWGNINTYTVQFEDEFFGLIGKKANPYRQSKTTFHLNYIPNSFDGRLNFTSTNKEKEQAWGIHNWNTYTIKEDKIKLKKHKNAEFFLPTYQYFIEFPLQIQTATAHNYVGEQEIDGVLCEGILLSWGTTTPQKSIDQYLVWINKETKLMVRLEYTIRDSYKFLTGATSYTHYKDFNGIKIATVLPVTSNLVKKGLLHKMKIHDITFDKIKEKELRPLTGTEAKTKK